MKDHLKIVAAMLLGLIASTYVGTMGAKETVTWQDSATENAIVQTDKRERETMSADIDVTDEELLAKSASRNGLN